MPETAHSEERRRIILDMPVSMYEMFALRAQALGGVMVDEFLRRGAALQSLLIEQALENGLLDSETIAEVTLRNESRNIKIVIPKPFADS